MQLFQYAVSATGLTARVDGQVLTATDRTPKDVSHPVGSSVPLILDGLVASRGMAVPTVAAYAVNAGAVSSSFSASDILAGTSF